MKRRDLLGSLGFLLGSCGPRLVPVETKDEPRKVHVARPKTDAAPVAADEGEKKDGFAAVEWNVLRGLDTRTGQGSPLLELIAGTNVRIAGYMVPLDDGFQEVNEFLLVPTAGACIHTPPPPGNQIVYATMSTGRPAKVELIYSVWAYGRLEISSTESPYGAAGYKLGVVELRRRG
ncbi:MAG TPA: DUF3299 domain-containing protein [Bryobacteraceae bacterium]|nr:DUF3299 domain-containing protein [Bryobacteraceae bacterium]